jgi:hypothetical protein
VLCHTNFTSEFFAAMNNPGQWAGALMLQVLINTSVRVPGAGRLWCPVVR